MLGDAPFIAFAATARPAEARAFYADVLGLRFVEETPFALVFEHVGTTLRLQKVESLHRRAAVRERRLRRGCLPVRAA